MKFLLAAYCVITPQGQRLIGAYKRILRLGMRLAERGHEVTVFAGGRDLYEDAFTKKAEQHLQFMETWPYSATPADIRRTLRKTLDTLRPHCVVIGDAPMGGPLLEATLCAVEDGIPLVFLENAYNPQLVHEFCRLHGAIADGIILTGLSACYTDDPPPHLCQVPLFIDVDTDAARKCVPGLKDGEPLITVLAYDQGAMALGVSIVEGLADQKFKAVFLAPESGHGIDDPRIHVIPPPSEETLCGLLQLSNLVVGKCGFLQLSECLMLGTPFVGLYYDKYFSPIDLPPVCREFVHATRSTVADKATIDKARSLFLGKQTQNMRVVHDGQGGGIDKAVAFIEGLSGVRASAESDCTSLGFTRERIQQAVGDRPVDTLRCTLLRNEPERQLFSLVAGYKIWGERRFTRMWGSRYPSPEFLDQDLKLADGSPRRLMHVWRDVPMAIEEDIGWDLLPPLSVH